MAKALELLLLLAVDAWAAASAAGLRTGIRASPAALHAVGFSAQNPFAPSWVIRPLRNPRRLPSGFVYKTRIFFQLRGFVDSGTAL